MLYLAVILTGGGDFVFRYFTAEQAAAACLAGTCFGLLFRNPVLMRSATLIVGARAGLLDLQRLAALARRGRAPRCPGRTTHPSRSR